MFDKLMQYIYKVVYKYRMVVYLHQMFHQVKSRYKANHQQYNAVLPHYHTCLVFRYIKNIYIYIQPYIYTLYSFRMYGLLLHTKLYLGKTIGTFLDTFYNNCYSEGS